MSVERIFEELGRAARDAAPAQDLDRGHARFRAVVEGPVEGAQHDGAIGGERAPRLRSRRWPWLALPAAAAAILLVVWLWPQPQLTCEVDGVALTPDHWVEAAGPRALRFSDGTRVAASPGSRLRVREAHTDGATVQLERGKADLDVESKPGARWQVDSGPFSIHVTGTSFTTSWEPTSQVFELHMLEGSVVLAGPVVGGHREVQAPERLRVYVASRELVVLGEEPTETASANVPAPVVEPEPDLVPADEPAPSPAPETPTATADWQALARAGKRAEALAIVHRQNRRALLETASAPTLMLLAQTARLAGEHRLATESLSALGRRFPQSTEAATARFLNGRMHFDRGDYSAASRDLEGYLAAAPGGAFAGEAEVLLILSLHHGGRGAEASRRAQRYLQDNPDGPHTARIRSLLEP